MQRSGSGVTNRERTITTGPGTVESLAGTVTASGGFITGAWPVHEAAHAVATPSHLPYGPHVYRRLSASRNDGAGSIAFPHFLM